MSKQEIIDFCDKHDACDIGKQWAVENCNSMQEVWEKVKPEWLVWIFSKCETISDADKRLFAVWCCKQIWHLIKDKRSKKAVCVANRYARGKASVSELAAASAAAWDAARAAAWDAAWEK